MTICHSRQNEETIELARLASLHEKPSAIPVQNYIILYAFRQGMPNVGLANLASPTVCGELHSGDKLDRMDEKPAPTIRDLYPYLNDDQLAEVEDTWERYLALVLRIFERLESQTDLSAGHLTQDSKEIPCELQGQNETKT